MQRLETIPGWVHITARPDGLAKCIRDIEDAQSFDAATAAPPIGQILDGLEQEFREAITDQMRSG
jgi:hypothetical protein